MGVEMARVASPWGECGESLRTGYTAALVAEGWGLEVMIRNLSVSMERIRLCNRVTRKVVCGCALAFGSDGSFRNLGGRADDD